MTEDIVLVFVYVFLLILFNFFWIVAYKKKKPNEMSD